MLIYTYKISITYKIDIYDSLNREVIWEYKIPFVEIDNLIFNYKNFKYLITEIKKLSETNALIDRKKLFEKKNYFKKVEKYYWENFSINNKLPVTYQIIYLSGWKKLF